MRKQFTFYGSFYDAVSVIKDPEARLQAYEAICSYALSGVEPDMDSLADAAAIAFIMAKPNLDAAKVKSDAGKRGGEKSKPEAGESIAEANVKQTEAEPKQNEAEGKQTVSKKENEGENKIEIEKENECYTSPAPSLDDCNFSPELRAAVNDWLTYKRERRESYKPTGLKSMLTRIEQSAAEYGDSAVIEIIRDSMASGYHGILFDRLKKGGAAVGTRGNTGESPKPKRNWGITYDV